VSEVISNSYGVSYPAINSSELVDIGIVIPSIDEQKKIVNFIDLNIKKIDHEIQHEERRKTLIKEYRQSLISSVVTGKVRVTEDMI
jgi:type I restriction enzyme S subunit